MCIRFFEEVDTSEMKSQTTGEEGEEGEEREEGEKKQVHGHMGHSTCFSRCPTCLADSNSPLRDDLLGFSVQPTR